MVSMRLLLFLPLLCVLPGCIILDLTDLGYMAAHHGRHIELDDSKGRADMQGFGYFDRFDIPARQELCVSFGGAVAGASRAASAAGLGGGKKTGSSDKALLSNIGAGPTGVNPLGGSTGAGSAALRQPATRPGGLTDGTVPGYGPDSPASGGQVVSALGLAGSILTGSVPGFLAGAVTEDKTRRTLAGREWDQAFGGKPGTPVDTRNPIADSTNRRGDVLQSNDGVLADRAGRSAAAALAGDAPQTGTDALFSDVTLADRRKPKSSLAGTQMLMKAVA